MSKVSVKWLSHAFFSITTPSGKTVIIDPWITNNPLCPVKLEDINKADLVLVTHDHFDHGADVVSIAKKTGAIVAAVPETAGKMKTQAGLPEGQVINFGFGMNVGGSANANGILVTMTQAFHSSETGCPVGYIVKLDNGTTIYHAGDTGIFSSMKTLGELYQIDIALLPIGSCFTMDPLQAAHALTYLNPKVVIPMHFKTFPILVQDASEFVTLAQWKAPSVKVVVLEPGGEYQF